MVQTRRMRRAQQQNALAIEQRQQKYNFDDLVFIICYLAFYIALVFYLGGQKDEYFLLKAIALIFLLSGLLQGCFIHLMQE